MITKFARLEFELFTKPSKSDFLRVHQGYLKRKNDEIRAILKDNDLNETEKFWNIVDFQKNELTILRNCLDGYSRSRMSLHMALMKKFEMIFQEDIEEFSEELQEHLKNIERI